MLNTPAKQRRAAHALRKAALQRKQAAKWRDGHGKERVQISQTKSRLGS